MKKPFWITVASLVMLLAVVGSFNLAVWVVDRDPPIYYEEAHALAPSVEQGGSLEVEFSVFRKRICPLTVRRWLYDAAQERHSIPQFTTGLQMLAGRETYRRSITVPASAAVGMARYEVVLDYTCNPLQQIFGPLRVTSPPIRFRVMPAQQITIPAPGSFDG